ncbi:MAG: type 4a pilus biogenesis protein PilO [Archangium sp.]|nr:type 4a pilus biogenesis protein PilO [Archangium sp.]
MSALSNLQNTVQQSFSALSVRERRLVIGAVCAVIAFVLFMVTFSFSNSADRIRQRTARKLAQLDEVQTLAANYREAKAAQDNAERQLAASNVRLLSYLEERAKQKGLELPSVNPKAEVPLENPKIVENAVELTLTDVKLNRLVDFLQAVEAGPGIVKVKYLRIEPHPQAEHLTAWMTVATYRLKN